MLVNHNPPMNGTNSTAAAIVAGDGAFGIFDSLSVAFFQSPPSAEAPLAEAVLELVELLTGRLLCNRTGVEPDIRDM